MEKEGRAYQCPECEQNVIICHHCDRGHVYCSKICAQAGNKKNNLASSLRYQETPQGKINHNKNQQAYSRRQKALAESMQSMIDNTSKSLANTSHSHQVSSATTHLIAALSKRTSRCHLCGSVVQIHTPEGNCRTDDALFEYFIYGGE